MAKTVRLQVSEGIESQSIKRNLRNPKVFYIAKFVQ